jgi:hypothetical protein
VIGIKSEGSFNRTLKFLEFMKSGDAFSNLDSYGMRGVDALSNATPIESGETAHSWGYKVSGDKGKFKIEWFNSHTNDGKNIAILIQYGHGTGTGGYVQGRDYINPAMRPIFDKIAEDIWREVTSA